MFELGECLIELMEPIDGPSVWRDHLERYGEGLHHIAFMAPEMNDAITFLAGHGLRMVQHGNFPNGQYASSIRRSA